jgi:hypothetical protein
MWLGGEKSSPNYQEKLMGFGLSGAESFTADGAVGPSGKPIRVFNWTVFSGASAAKPVLRNGTSASGTLWASFTGTASAGASEDFHEGRRFPDGCFYDHDANASNVVIEWRLEK